MFHNAVEFAVLYPGEEAPRWASARRDCCRAPQPEPAVQLKVASSRKTE
jgi:hypothetical protein